LKNGIQTTSTQLKDIYDKIFKPATPATPST